LLEKLADLNLTLDKCEQAIDYSRRSAYLKCGVVAPINIEPSIIPAPHPDEIHIEDSNPLLSQPFRVSAENMHRRHPYSTTPNHI